MTDYEKLVVALRKMKPFLQKSSDPAWSRAPALRVIDCVLPLNRSYDRFVVPRLERFQQDHPAVRTVNDLHALIASYDSPNGFVMNTLHYKHEARANTLADVVNWLVIVSGKGRHDEQLSNLERWATGAQPADFARLGIRGFGLAGFQYLRMLFGANTTKPDLHIWRYVAKCIGHEVSPTQALLLLESAASKAPVLLRDLNTTVWERSARGKDA